MRIYTMGVFGSSEEVFFEKLRLNSIDTFLDIRNKPNMKDTNYVFADSIYLEAKLKSLGIKYFHIKGLAPTQAIRQLQKDEDKSKGILKKDRTQIAETFKTAYFDEILSHFDFDNLLQHLRQNNAEKVLLFCVEELYTACHRSLAAQEIHKRFCFEIIHL